MFMTVKQASEKWGISDRRYNAFDEYHVKHNLSSMENLFAGYINARLDMYLDML